MRRCSPEKKEDRIKKRLKNISDFYDMVFEIKGPIEIKEFKEEMNFANDEKELVSCCKKLAKLIHFFDEKAKENPSDVVYKNTSFRLREVFAQTTELIKDEFRTVRTRNNRIPQLEN